VIPEEADRLYGLPLADFVPERTELAKRLRADGRRDEAAAVAKLAKPTVAAWAANQVLRTQGRAARELLAAGDALAVAKADGLRAAITRHREALATMVDAARGLLDPDGKSLSQTTVERVQQTLNAVSLDPELREEGGAGRLTKEHAFSGLPKAPGRAAKKSPKAKAKKPKPKPEADRAYEAKLRKAEERAAKAAAELEELRRRGAG
jgi:hypothetical protein